MFGNQNHNRPPGQAAARPRRQAYPRGRDGSQLFRDAVSRYHDTRPQHAQQPPAPAPVHQQPAAGPVASPGAAAQLPPITHTPDGTVAGVPTPAPRQPRPRPAPGQPEHDNGLHLGERFHEQHEGGLHLGQAQRPAPSDHNTLPPAHDLDGEADEDEPDDYRQHPFFQMLRGMRQPGSQR